MVLCDERHQLGYDFAADKGITELTGHLEENYEISFSTRYPYEPQFPVKFEKSDSDDHSFAEEKTRICFQGEVLLNNRVTAEDHFQETRLIRNGLKINSLLVTSHPFYFVNSNSLKSNFEFS